MINIVTIFLRMQLFRYSPRIKFIIMINLPPLLVRKKLAIPGISCIGYKTLGNVTKPFKTPCFCKYAPNTIKWLSEHLTVFSAFKVTIALYLSKLYLQSLFNLRVYLSSELCRKSLKLIYSIISFTKLTANLVHDGQYRDSKR